MDSSVETAALLLMQLMTYVRWDAPLPEHTEDKDTRDPETDYYVQHPLADSFELGPPDDEALATLAYDGNSSLDIGRAHDSQSGTNVQLVFDLDGVLHTNVISQPVDRNYRPDFENGEVHPLSGSVLSHLSNYFNEHVKMLCNMWPSSTRYIQSRNPSVSTHRMTISTLLANKGVEIPVENIHGEGGNKSKRLQRLLDPNSLAIFFDDSPNVMNEVLDAVRKRTLRDLTVVHYSPKDLLSLRFMTYNVSWESTKPTTDKFGQLGYASRSDVGVTRQNIVAAILACDPDLLALQEVCPEFYEYLKGSELWKRYWFVWLYDYNALGPEGQLTCWKKGLGLGRPQVTRSKLGQRGRPFTALNFTELDFIVINLHAQHDYNEQYFDNNLKHALSSPHTSPHTRCVVLGDFNKDLHSFTIGGRRFNNCRRSPRSPISTCCSVEKGWDGDLAFDHVFYYGLRVSLATRKIHVQFPASDHEPVFADLRA